MAFLNVNHESSDSDDESLPPWDGWGGLSNNGIQRVDAAHSLFDAQYGVPALAGKLSPQATPIHRAHKEEHREKFSESTSPFFISCVRPDLWARPK